MLNKEINELDSKIYTLNSDKKTKKERLDWLKGSVDHQNKELEKLKLVIKTSDSENFKLQLDVKNKQKEFDNLTSQIELLDAQILTLKKELKQAKAKNEKLVENKKKIDSAYESIQTLIKNIKTILKNIKSDFSELNKEIKTLKELSNKYIQYIEQWLNPKEDDKNFEKYYLFLIGFQNEIEPKQTAIKQITQKLKDNSTSLENIVKEINQKIQEITS
ncbi:hypothetical protein [Mycoplasma leachii]|uniref:hypothetical protein n=1 Tax=Mycoplasma leachii TaxID=2105 RepID=UPI002159ABA1|nr:hypothetical protein [Mycoplasma leachii]